MENTQDYIQTTAREVITSFLRVDPEELQLETHIVDDLGADSLALVELGFKLSESFGIPDLNTGDGNLLIFKNLLAYIKENCSRGLGN